MLGIGDIFIVDNKAHKLHNKPCIVTGTKLNWQKKFQYIASPLDLKIKPRSYIFFPEETIYSNPYAILELAENLRDNDLRSETIRKYHLKDVKKNGYKPV